MSLENGSKLGARIEEGDWTELEAILSLMAEVAVLATNLYFSGLI